MVEHRHNKAQSDSHVLAFARVCAQFTECEISEQGANEQHREQPAPAETVHAIETIETVGHLGWPRMLNTRGVSFFIDFKKYK